MFARLCGEVRLGRLELLPQPIDLGVGAIFDLAQMRLQRIAFDLCHCTLLFQTRQRGLQLRLLGTMPLVQLVSLTLKMADLRCKFVSSPLADR